MAEAAEAVEGSLRGEEGWGWGRGDKVGQGLRLSRSALYRQHWGQQAANPATSFATANHGQQVPMCVHLDTIHPGACAARQQANLNTISFTATLIAPLTLPPSPSSPPSALTPPRASRVQTCQPHARPPVRCGWGCCSGGGRRRRLCSRGHLGKGPGLEGALGDAIKTVACDAWRGSCRGGGGGGCRLGWRGQG